MAPEALMLRAVTERFASSTSVLVWLSLSSQYRAKSSSNPESDPESGNDTGINDPVAPRGIASAIVLGGNGGFSSPPLVVSRLCGDRVLSSPRVVFDRRLRELLFQPLKLRNSGDFDTPGPTEASTLTPPKLT